LYVNMAHLSHLQTQNVMNQQWITLVFLTIQMLV
jgi:hypothetical protein